MVRKQNECVWTIEGDGGRQTEMTKLVETETTVGTRLESAAARARAKTLSAHTVAAASPTTAPPRTTNARAARPSNAILPHSAAAAPSAPAIAASAVAHAFILVTSEKRGGKKKTRC